MYNEARAPPLRFRVRNARKKGKCTYLHHGSCIVYQQFSRGIPCILEESRPTFGRPSRHPRNHFNGVIAQWEVNRNAFMVHLPKRIGDPFPCVLLSVACHKKLPQKERKNSRNPSKSSATRKGGGGGNGHEGVRLHWVGPRAPGVVFIKSPVKRNGINFVRHLCIVRDAQTANMASRRVAPKAFRLLDKSVRKEPRYQGAVGYPVLKTESWSSTSLF